ncbi:hypothetical protein DIPPA_14656 [Diplonema papillatum]|nr:hypothetical protein DIPPA_14656 [Diplonema papillatum]
MRAGEDFESIDVALPRQSLAGEDGDQRDICDEPEAARSEYDDYGLVPFMEDPDDEDDDLSDPEGKDGSDAPEGGSPPAAGPHDALGHRVMQKHELVELSQYSPTGQSVSMRAGEDFESIDVALPRQSLAGEDGDQRDICDEPEAARSEYDDYGLVPFMEDPDDEDDDLSDPEGKDGSEAPEGGSQVLPKTRA